MVEVTTENKSYSNLESRQNRLEQAMTLMARSDDKILLIMERLKDNENATNNLRSEFHKHQLYSAPYFETVKNIRKFYWLLVGIIISGFGGLFVSLIYALGKLGVM